MTFSAPFSRVFRPAFDRRAAAAAAAPWWLSGGVAAANCLAAYTPKGAASLAASYDNNAAPGNGLADGTYDAAPGVAPTFDAATGWTFGSGRYLTTGISSFPVTGSWLVRCSDGPSDGTTPASPLGFYSLDPSARFLVVLLNYFGNQLWGNTNAALASKGSPLTAGVFAAADRTVYQNGDSVGTLAAAGAMVTDRRIYLGAAQHPFSGLSYAYTGKIQAVAIYNVTISAAQVLAISTAMGLL